MKNFFKQFGGRVTKEMKSEYTKSENWRDGSFQNLEETTLTTSVLELPRIIYKQLINKKAREPKSPLPIKPFYKHEFLAPSSNAKFIWYGHAVVLMRMTNKTILIDPMFGPDTTPIAPMATKRFSENTLEIIDDLPEIDLLLMTHDHYDHLDYQSIQKLKQKTKSYFVALGIKRHLVSWGVDPHLIVEFDWWQSNVLDDLKITFTPTRHFAGRGLHDRLQTLWGGWMFESPAERIWFSGDGGYGNHFQEVGKRFDAIDFAFMECGQYNEDWRPIHLFPDEAVQAAIDANVKKVMPVHWAGFALSYQHTWKEPGDLFVEAAIERGIDYVLPMLGNQFQVDSDMKEKWWNAEPLKDRT